MQRPLLLVLQLVVIIACFFCPTDSPPCLALPCGFVLCSPYSVLALVPVPINIIRASTVQNASPVASACAGMNPAC
ncbi:hypothetical protein J3E69DRAFT_343278 [Trichoderma sp. SZMC 28015]